MAGITTFTGSIVGMELVETTLHQKIATGIVLWVIPIVFVSAIYKYGAGGRTLVWT